MKSLCTIGDCQKPVHGRGMCPAHYRRWRKGLKVDAPLFRRSDPPYERVIALSKTLDNGCIVYHRATNTGGYAQVKVNGRGVPVHRVVYEYHNGSIPEGHDIDHICWNRACVNINHLRLATRGENCQNRQYPLAGQSKYRGVYRNGNGWAAQVKKNGKIVFSKTFKAELDAAIAAEKARVKHFTHYIPDPKLERTAASAERRMNQ